ncbi:SMI1/KNR4 family protein [Flavobacterium helocola]|uniref:SMI1/KNR4 family protein n=1 Tax=Flavobacterium helocola TaxID=3139139 RepID=A0ABU9I9C9_9FLAO
MILTFKQREDSQNITQEELNDFEALIGFTLPQDYRLHMFTHNGGVVNEDVKHINYPEGGEGISYFYEIKYGNYTIEQIFSNLKGKIPDGYLAIGSTDNCGHIIISLNNDNTYGNTKEWFPDGYIYDLSPSFTQLLNDMILDEDED